MAHQARWPKNSAVSGSLINSPQDAINSWGRPEVLLVEDNTGVFEEIGSILQNQGFQVLLAPDPETALEEIGNYQVDVVMVSASRQDTGGLRVVDQAKQLNPEVVTVVLTRGFGGDLPVEAYEIDIDCYLGWPVLPVDLGRRLMNLLAGDLLNEPSQQPDESSGIVDRRAWFLLGRFVYEVWNSLNQVSDSLSHLHAQKGDSLSGTTATELQDLSRTITQMTDTVQQFIQETSWPEHQLAEIWDDDLCYMA